MPTLLKPRLFARDESGKMTDKGLPKNWNSVYKASVIRYMNYLEPLFDKAQQKSEWDFALTLMRVRGTQDAGWDSYENSLEVVDKIMGMEEKLSGDVKLNIFLWLYGHIVEASEPYETTANLLNICLGKPFRAFNFPYIKTKTGFRPQYPSDKIASLDKLATSVNMQDVTKPIKEALDRELRNAVYHSDYAVYNGEVRLSTPSRLITAAETLKITNRTLAYHEVFKNLIEGYKKGYKDSKLIDVPNYFSNGEDKKAIIIIRQGYGLTGVKSIWTEEEIAKGKIPFFLGHYLPYEKKLIDKGKVLLPRNRIDFWNKFLKRLPKFLSSKAVPIIETHIINR